MYDYRMVFVYPLSMPVEDLSELEESALGELEKSITAAVDGGWEYLSTTTFSNTKTQAPPANTQGLKAFVYRRLRAVHAEYSGPAAAALLEPVRDRAVRHEEDPVFSGTTSAKAHKKTTLLTLALLNAVHAHSKIEPETILPKLRHQGDISNEEQMLLSSALKKPLSAVDIAKITPPGQEKDVFRVSLMPFGDEDDEYSDYVAELAVYLNLDDAFISREVSRKRL